MLPFRLLARDAVTERIAGPAILLEPTATTYLDAGFEASAGAEGELSITPERGG
jgi:N-methylhydantoinase A